MARGITQIDLPQAVVRTRSVSTMDNNVYLITVKSTGAQLLIDAADEPAAVLQLIEAAKADAGQPSLWGILTTHSHWDHIRALKAVVAATGAPTYAGREDVAAIEQATGSKIGHPVDDGDTLDLPGLPLGLIGLRGHTPGSITVVLSQPNTPTYLFTGDSLFPGGVGNTDHDPARFTQLYGDVTARIFDRFDDTTLVYPGHGQPTNLGSERPQLEQWRRRGW